MQLDGFTCLCMFALHEASLKRSSLLTDDKIFDLVRDGLLGLQAVKTVAHLASSVLAGVDQVAVVDRARFHNRLVKVIVIYHDRELEKLSLFHREHIFDGDGSDTLYHSAIGIGFGSANFDHFRALKSFFNLFDRRVALLRLVSEDWVDLAAR